MLGLPECLPCFRLDAAHWWGPAIFLRVERRLECQLRLILLEFDLFVCSVVSELWLVQILLHILMLLPKILLHGTEISLDNFALNGSIHALVRVQVRTLEMLRVRILIFTEPVVEDTYGHIFVIRTWLERTSFQFFFLVLESNIFYFDTLLSWPLVQSRAVLGAGKRVALLRFGKFVRFWSHLRLESFFLTYFWSRLRCALLPTQLLLIRLFIV